MTMGAGDSTEGRDVKLRRMVSALQEVNGATLTVWAPVLLAFGIWTYFAMEREPTWPLLVVAGAVVAVCFGLQRANALVLVLAIAISGFVLAKLRTEWVATPLLRAVASDVMLRGVVVEAERRSAKRMLLVLDVTEAVGLPENETPVRVRITLNSAAALPRIGDTVKGQARLAPLPLPTSPGAFDFGRSLFFESIGATGRFTGSLEQVDRPIAWRYKLRRSFHALRANIGERVRAAIPRPLGLFADALITGERAQIPREMNQSLRDSGLFHILSISGLHMALVAGSAFWLVRAALAAVPVLALRFPIKKWAAATALIVGLFYMLLADSGAATERSFIMIAVVFFAIMVDRPAISLHNLAIAAIVILVREPEQAISASFQMSFMAVTGLAAFFLWWNRRQELEVRQPRGFVARQARNLWFLAVASLATSLIAGLLSGIPAAHHFGRLAPYGVVANALALPIVSTAVMPMALLSAFLMPFGLEQVPLTIMGQGLGGVMWVSDLVAGWPNAGLALPLLSAGAALLLSVAAVLACLTHGWWKLTALPLAVAGGLWGGMNSKPDVFIDERARTMAVRNDSGDLIPLPGRRGVFSVRRWLEQEGKTELPDVKKRAATWTCDAAVCATTSNGRSIVFLKETAEIVKPCPVADVVAAQYPLRRLCKGKLVTIDRFDVWRGGATTLHFQGSSVVVETARAAQGARPWVWQPRARTSSYGVKQ